MPKPAILSGRRFPGSQPLSILVAAVVAAAQAAAHEGPHPFDIEQVASFPRELLLLVEIPADGRVRYEVVEVGDFEDAATARRALSESAERYRREPSRPR